MNINFIEDNIVIDNNILNIPIKEKDVVLDNKYQITKRCIDIFAGLIGVLILIPLIIIVFIMKLINKESGPIFYSQLRIGKNGQPFKIYKFRSMVVNADEILKGYLKNNTKEAIEYKEYKKIKNDPRITKTGEFLRKASLDEWPQFINVLLGDMSLVGPRPYLLSEKEEMGEYYKDIINVKPGITGPWQVAGRSNISFEDRLKLDKEYSSIKGNKGDAIIILKTFKRVLKKEGAV